MNQKTQIFKFIVVGLINTIFGYSLYALLLSIGMHFSAAVAISTILGVIFNFKTVGAFVFRSNDNKKFIRFVLVYIIVYLLNISGIGLLTSTGASPFVGGALMLLPCAIATFVLQKKLVFNNE